MDEIVIELDDRDGRVPRLSIRGEIDQSTVDALYDALDRIDIEAEELVLDLRDVTFLASAGITFLLRAARHLDVRVSTASMPVRRVLDMTGLTTPFGLDADQPDDERRIS